MEQTIDAVRAAVDDGRMRPGVKYSVYQVAEALGISRTPVRDALLQLEQVGLIRFERRQGFRILLPEPREIAEIFSIRLRLEVPGVRHAAARRTPEQVDLLRAQIESMREAAEAGDKAEFARRDQRLHDLVLDAAGHHRARSIIASLRETTRLLGASTFERTRPLRDIAAEHVPIVDAIAAGDVTAAETVMRTHLVRTGTLLVAQAVRDQNSDADPDEIWHEATEDLLPR